MIIYACDECECRIVREHVSINLTIGGQEYHFCSERCLSSWLEGRAAGRGPLKPFGIRWEDPMRESDIKWSLAMAADLVGAVKEFRKKRQDPMRIVEISEMEVL
jgi:hypothetical protein